MKWNRIKYITFACPYLCQLAPAFHLIEWQPTPFTGSVPTALVPHMHFHHTASCTGNMPNSLSPRLEPDSEAMWTWVSPWGSHIWSGSLFPPASLLSPAGCPELLIPASFNVLHPTTAGDSFWQVCFSKANLAFYGHRFLRAKVNKSLSLQFSFPVLYPTLHESFSWKLFLRIHGYFRPTSLRFG